MKMTKKEKKILKKYFGIYINKNSDGIDYTLEQWTDGGVDMLIYIDGRDKKTVTEQFIEYIENFDIDEEIDIYRQDKSYREVFTISRSLYDFESWIKYCENIKDELLGG